MGEELCQAATLLNDGVGLKVEECGAPATYEAETATKVYKVCEEHADRLESFVAEIADLEVEEL